MRSRSGVLRHVLDGRIDPEVALEIASSPHDFKLMLDARGRHAGGIAHVLGDDPDRPEESEPARCWAAAQAADSACNTRFIS